MRAQDFLNEIAPIGNIEPGTLITPPKPVTGVPVNYKKLPGNNPYYYVVNTKGDKLNIYIFDSNEANNEVIGVLTTNPVSFPLRNTRQVDYITVHSHFTRFGIGKALYGIHLAILKSPLISGEAQTPGGQRNWLSLFKIPGVVIKGYMAISDSQFDISKPSNKTKQAAASAARFTNKIEDIMQTGAQYLGKSSNGKHYFSFDLTEDTVANRMKAAVDTVEIYNRDDSDIGMYAVWTGKAR